ncbi:hypothetical protein KM043_014869 [Ampulex compressa]|nr:hypothetical protein KM043_014869 [Ampulex compressa]
MPFRPRRGLRSRRGGGGKTEEHVGRNRREDSSPLTAGSEIGRATIFPEISSPVTGSISGLGRRPALRSFETQMRRSKGSPTRFFLHYATDAAESGGGAFRLLDKSIDGDESAVKRLRRGRESPSRRSNDRGASIGCSVRSSRSPRQFMTIGIAASSVVTRPCNGAGLLKPGTGHLTKLVQLAGSVKKDSPPYRRRSSRLDLEWRPRMAS